MLRGAFPCLRQWNKSSFTTMLLLKCDREAQVFSSGPEVAPATMEGVVFQASQFRCSPGMQSGILNGAQQSLNARHKDEEQCNFFLKKLIFYKAKNAKKLDRV